MNRRHFITQAAIAAAALAVPGLAAAKKHPAKIRWTMLLTWSKHMDLFTQSAIRFAKQVSLLSESRLAIDVTVAPKGMPPQLILDKVRRGEIHCTHGLASHVADDSWQWYGQVPFGMDAQQTDVWFTHGKGQSLLSKIAMEQGLRAAPMGNLGSIPFAWSKKSISTTEDLRGLRISAPELAKPVLQTCGALVHPMRPQSNAKAFAAGKLDAVASFGAHNDTILGTPALAPYCIQPGWQAPSTPLFFFINKQAYEALPAILRRILDTAVQEEHLAAQTAMRFGNAAAMRKLHTPKHIHFTPQALAKLRSLFTQSQADNKLSPMAQRIRNSYQTTQNLFT